MNNLIKWLKRNGYTFELTNLTNGNIGIFVNLYTMDEYRNITGNINSSKLMAYIKRYNLCSQYRANYTSLLITEAN